MITLTGRMLALLLDMRPAGLRLSGFLFAPWRAPVTSAHPWYDEPAGPRRSDLIAVEGSRGIPTVERFIEKRSPRRSLPQALYSTAGAIRDAVDAVHAATWLS